MAWEQVGVFRIQFNHEQAVSSAVVTLTLCTTRAFCSAWLRKLDLVRSCGSHEEPDVRVPAPKCSDGTIHMLVEGKWFC